MKPVKYLLLTIVLLASACRKDAPELINPNDQQLLNTPSQIFEAFWHAMNNCYVFWDIDPTDWDQVYDDYLPRFRELDGLKTVENKTLEELYTEICKDLVDHHYNLEITNPQAPADAETQQINIQPTQAEIMGRDYFHYPFSWDAFDLCIAKYKAAGRITDYTEGLNDKVFACSYNIDDGIIYLYLLTFQISDADPSDPEDTVMTAIDNYLRLILETPEIKGVILDLRLNRGGQEADLQYILAPLIDTKLPFGYTRTKTGPGRLDYGPWVPETLTPAAQHRKIEAPIVVVTDIFSASMSEITAMIVSQLPNGCIVGERTYGGTGPLTKKFSYSYTGQSENSCISIYTSTSMTKDLDGVIYEGVGITPDIEALYDEAAMEAGTDVQLDRAIEYIHTGR